MTTPTPEPARAEPVGGDIRECLYRLKNECEIEGLDARPGFDAWCSWANKLLGTTAQRLIDAAAPPPASDAGLAEVERLIQTYAAATINWAHDPDRYIGRVNAAHGALVNAIAALRTERDRLRADAAGRGEGVFGPERHMDEIDAAREAFGWLEALALKLPRIANEQITIEREDVGVRVYWRENKPHAVMLTIRDGLNFTFGMGFNLARIAAAPAPATDGTGGRSDG